MTDTPLAAMPEAQLNACCKNRQASKLAQTRCATFAPSNVQKVGKLQGLLRNRQSEYFSSTRVGSAASAQTAQPCVQSFTDVSNVIWQPRPIASGFA